MSKDGLKKDVPGHPRWLSLTLAVALACGAASAPSTLNAQRALPALGGDAGQALSPGAERRLGDQIMRELRRDPALLDDPLLLDHAQGLWQRLLAAARQRGDLGPDIDQAFAWEVFLVRDRAINAFALPGGYVGLHLGLIGNTATADELASVLAHELSHVTQRHIARGIGQAERQGTVGVATMILGLLLAGRINSPDLAQAAIAGSQAALVQGQLNFSRDMEREADRIGWGLFHEAGFAPAGMAAMFDRLDQASRLNDSGGFTYLRSHPLTTERLAEARSRLTPEGDGRAQGAGPAQGYRHALMQARARVLMDPSTIALRRLVGLADAGGSAGTDTAPGLEYGGALAALMLGDPARARLGLDRLWTGLAKQGRLPGAGRELFREDMALLALLGVEIALARQDAVDARRWMALADAGLSGNELSGAGPSDAGPAAAKAFETLTRPRLLARAEVALIGRTDPGGPYGTGADSILIETSGQLRHWLSTHAADAAAWSALARLEQAQGHTLRSLRAHAEAQAARGDLDGAIERLQAAQSSLRAPPVTHGDPLSSNASRIDFIEASVIDARLRHWLALRQQRANEFRRGTAGSR